MDDAQLKTVWQNRQLPWTIEPLAAPVTYFVKHTLGKRVRQLSDIAKVWQELVPPEIREHTALEGLYRGVLRVTVDSAPHRFRLEKLLSGGLRKQIQDRYKGALNRIRLVPGQFCSTDDNGQQRFEF